LGGVNRRLRSDRLGRRSRLLRGRGIGLAGSDGILEALQGLTNRRAGIGQFPWADDDQNDY
jgi:hypothetical protein